MKVDDWYVSIAVHWHINPDDDPPTNGPRFMFVPGYAGWQQATNPGFARHFPAYNATVHVDEWCSNSGRMNTRFAGKARYPSKTS